MTLVLGQRIPDALARSAAKWGEPGARWLESLAGRVDDLVDRWDLTTELPLYPEGQCSIVVPVVRPDGTNCILKVQWPHPEAEHEAVALRAYDGRGAVRLLNEDRGHNAFLLERCEPGTSAWEAGTPAEVLFVSAQVMRRLWRPLQSTHPFTHLAIASAERAEDIRRTFVDHGRPFEAQLAEVGASAFERLGSFGADEVLLHGDFHPANVLRARREPWLAVDPKPLVGDPAFDTAQLLLNFRGRNWPMISTVAELAMILELDRDRVWDWAFARAVEEITWSMEDGGAIDEDLATARLFARLRG